MRTKASCWGEVDHRFSSLVGVAEKEEESGESMLGGQAGPKTLNAVSRAAPSFPFDKQQSVSEGFYSRLYTIRVQFSEAQSVRRV